MLNVLYEDSDIIVVKKPAGIESQSRKGLAADMVSQIKRHIHIFSPKTGEPYVGVIHRLDKPVSGIMVYAKTKNAAANLSNQVASGKMEKKYYAVLCGKPVDNVDNYVDYLLKDEKTNLSRIVDKGITDAKIAKLRFQVLETIQDDRYGELTLVQIELLTGRHHQIRVQMAGHGTPLWGDCKYNPIFAEASGSAAARPAGRTVVNLALSACELTFTHPVSGRKMTVSQQPEGGMFRNFHKCQ